MENGIIIQNIHSASPFECQKVTVPPNTVCFDHHIHEAVELMYITKGAIFVKSDNTEITAIAGTVFAFNYRQIHNAKSLSNGAEYYLIRFGLVDHISNEHRIIPALISGNMFIKTLIRDAEVNDCIEQIIEECAQNDTVSPLMLSGLLDVLIAMLVRRFVENKAEASTLGDKFERVLNYVNEHYTEDITTKSLAEFASYEESYFCRRFSEITGMSVTNYIRMLRMEKAKKQLLNEQTDITKVAHACGYSSLNYFTRCFKAYFGITPTEMISLKNK